MGESGSSRKAISWLTGILPDSTLSTAEQWGSAEWIVDLGKHSKREEAHLLLTPHRLADHQNQARKHLHSGGQRSRTAYGIGIFHRVAT